MNRKPLFFAALVAVSLVLFACGGANNVKTTSLDESSEPARQKSSTTSEFEEIIPYVRQADSPIAFEALQLILQNGLDGTDKDIAEFFSWRADYLRSDWRNDYSDLDKFQFDGMRPDGNNNTYYFNDDYGHGWHVVCQALKAGGWAVLLDVDYEVGDWYSVQYFTYRYVDGKMIPDPELLPNPKFDDIYNDPAMLEDLSEDRIAQLKGEMNADANNYSYLTSDMPYIELTGCPNIDAMDAYFDITDFEFPTTVYVWDGEKFVYAGLSKDFNYAKLKEIVGYDQSGHIDDENL